jgi:hypothetical protein
MFESGLSVSREQLIAIKPILQFSRVSDEQNPSGLIYFVEYF